MNEDRLDKVLTGMFRRVSVDELAKSRLKKRLFGEAELSDDDLSQVAAAGNPAELKRKGNIYKR